ncbi:MAG TPA: threonine synthase [Anaerolineaceae bacterium]|nr:threonine synthase [Anaerolineaceae bacterium]
MTNFLGYRCSICQTEYQPSQVNYLCPQDGGNLEVVLDYTAIRRHYHPEDVTARTDPSLWRYLPPLIPVDDPLADGTPMAVAGWTPLYRLPKLAAKLGVKHLWIKDEGRNPTASFKDRASAVVIARAKEINAEVVVTASTGNAGAALAGMAAAVGQRSVIFAPRTAPPAKVAQLLVYGAKVILVDGNYDQAFDLAVESADRFGWYCRNTGYNPFTLEGKKTAAFEIWETVFMPADGYQGQLCVFVSVGDGNIISGLHKGFKELNSLGWLEVMPRLFGVQAEGSAAVANAFHSGGEHIEPVHAQTLADSISVDLPRDGLRAVRAARETGGTYLTVTDEQILQAIAALGKIGVFSEPAGATAYAGLLTALRQGLIKPQDAVLVMNTGNGLKDIQAAMRSVPQAPVIEPTMTALEKYLQKEL